MSDLKCTKCGATATYVGVRQAEAGETRCYVSQDRVDGSHNWVET